MSLLSCEKAFKFNNIAYNPYKVLYHSSKITGLACSPLCHSTAVVNDAGFIYIIDMSNFNQIRVIHGIRLDRSSLKHLM